MPTAPHRPRPPVSLHPRLAAFLVRDKKRAAAAIRLRSVRRHLFALWTGVTLGVLVVVAYPQARQLLPGVHATAQADPVIASIALAALGLLWVLHDLHDGAPWAVLYYLGPFAMSVIAFSAALVGPEAPVFSVILFLALAVYLPFNLTTQNPYARVSASRWLPSSGPPCSW